MNQSSRSAVGDASWPAAVAAPNALTAVDTVRSMTLESAPHMPASVTATKSDWIAMSHTPGLFVRRCSAPATSAPAPMPTRITVSSNEKTARNAPSMIEK